MNKRYVLVNRRRFYLFLILTTIALSSVFFATTINGADTKACYTIITVKKGDTLWDLAKEYNKKGDIRQYIHEIETANHLNESMIFEGSILKLPL